MTKRKLKEIIADDDKVIVEKPKVKNKKVKDTKLEKVKEERKEKVKEKVKELKELKPMIKNEEETTLSVDKIEVFIIILNCLL